jgi:alpha-L-rhamnosidase
MTMPHKVKFNRWIFCLLASLMIGVVGCATHHEKDASVRPGWTAEWIGPSVSTSNLWTCYRKTFVLDQVPTQVLTRIGADSKYWLWVNGELAVREGGLKRGPTPDGTYFDELDLAPYLHKGSNTIAALVWYFGKDGFSHNSSGRAGFIFEAAGSGQTIKSDASWKMKRPLAFSTAGGVQPNRRLAESSIFFDARQDLAGWTAGGYDDESWESPVVAGVPPIQPWGPLELRPIPFWKDYGLKDYVNTRVLTNTAAGGTVIVAKLPYDGQVTPWLKIDAPAGRKIDVRTDDFMGGGEPNVHAEYITRDGVQEFEAFGWMNGHEIHYTIPADVKVLELKYRETGFDTEFTGRFHCDDPFFNTLWQKACRTLYVTMRDNFMDCPDRERGQWWGDTVNELGEVFYAFAPSGASLTRKAMLELARWQRGNHTLYSPVPSGKTTNELDDSDHGDGTWNSELPAQMLASVGQCGFWTYYLYTGDRNTLATVYPHVRAYLNIWHLDADGLVVHRAGDWDWEDWGDNIDAPVLDNAWYYLALEGAVNTARACGQGQDIIEWQARMKRLKAGFNAKFWNGSEYRSPDCHGDTDDRANALAVVAGLAKIEQYPALRKVMANHYNASPYMEKYVLESLYLMGAPDQALARMKQRYGPEVASNLTTLWENWELGGGTYNHAWSGGPLTMLSQYAAGIAPIEPGYTTYAVRPQMGALSAIESTVSTVKGTIELSVLRTTNSFRLNLDSPKGTFAHVAFPRLPGHQVLTLRINGKSIPIRSGQSIRGVRFLTEEENWFCLEVKPGTWAFEVDYE